MISTPNTPLGSQVATSTEEAMNRAVQGAHTMVDRLAEKAVPAVEGLVSGVNSASEALKTGADDLGAMQERWIENCRGYVREHPLVSVGVAVAAGVLLSRLMAR